MNEQPFKTKQVIVIRKDLKMRRGKEIAQGAHASIAWLTNRVRQTYDYDENKSNLNPIGLSVAEWSWIQGSFKKICVYVNSEEELLAVYEAGKKLHIACELITDAGLTEFGGVPTNTCCAIGPATDDLIDSITKHLPLY